MNFEAARIKMVDNQIRTTDVTPISPVCFPVGPA